MLENRAESHQSTARFVGRLKTLAMLDTRSNKFLGDACRNSESMFAARYNLFSHTYLAWFLLVEQVAAQRFALPARRLFRATLRANALDIKVIDYAADVSRVGCTLC